MRAFLALLISIAFASGSGYGLELGKNAYESILREMEAQDSNFIIMLLDNGMQIGMGTSIPGEARDGLALASSALKRMGELRLGNSTARMKIRAILDLCSPSMNLDKPKFAAEVRQVFNLAAWALGRTGNDDDMAGLAGYIPSLLRNEGYYGDSLYYIILAFGEVENSDAAVDALYEMSTGLRSEMLLTQVVRSLSRHSGFNALHRLRMMREEWRYKLSGEFRALIDRAIAEGEKRAE